MRVVNVILGALSVGAIAALGTAGCGSSSTPNPTGTGAGTSTSSSTSTSTSSGGQKFPCSPTAKCKEPNLNCIGLVENKGLTKFGLRMSELDISSPPKLASGLIANIIAPSVYPNVATCNLTGTALFNWLLQFDTMAGTLRTGGAKPVADPTMGYAFDEEMVTQNGKMFNIQPITLMTKPDASGNFSVTTGMNLIVPIYLNAGATSVVLLPLQQARLLMGTLSADQDCIGSYNAMGLDPTANCAPDMTHPLFNTAGKLDGFITLEDADGVQISQLSETLCVLLSPDATMYGQPGTGANAGVTVCKRDMSNKIVFQPMAADGGWCSTSNSAATASCADSVQLAASFAASSVKITN